MNAMKTEVSLPYVTLFREAKLRGKFGQAGRRPLVGYALIRLAQQQRRLGKLARERHVLEVKTRRADRVNDIRLTSQLTEETARVDAKISQEQWLHLVIDNYLKQELHQLNSKALCLSGGGIRSATFSLGVLQELARYSIDRNTGRYQLLCEFDFLSTVSGGGYTGAWLSGWSKRHTSGFVGVVEELASGNGVAIDPDPPTVRHLRQFSNYLTPRVGFFSKDTWTLIAIFFRNLLLNWLMVLPLVAGLLLLPVIFLHFTSAAAKNNPEILLMTLGGLGVVVAVIYICQKLPGIRHPGLRESTDTTHYLSLVGVPFFISGWALSTWWLGHELTAEKLPVVSHHAILVLLFVVSAGSFLLRDIRTLRARIQESRRAPHILRTSGRLLIEFASSLLAISCGAALLYWLSVRVAPTLLQNRDDLRPFIILAIPLLFVLFMLTGTVMNGVKSNLETEEDREWWARSGAIITTFVLAWVVLTSIPLYSREITDSLGVFLPTTLPVEAKLPVLATLLGAIGSYLGFTPMTPGNRAGIDVAKVSRTARMLSRLDWLIPVIGILFFLILALVLSNFNRWAVEAVTKEFPMGSPGLALRHLLVAAVILLGSAWVFNLFFNVNIFSLHGMYRSRLIRAYLGASNEYRRPDSFTNFDPFDNFPLADAAVTSRDPIHLLNLTLNLVATRNLAWQQRKAEPFSATPISCGSFRLGYRPTRAYAGRQGQGITLGTAMTISGAAASPNMGYHSSPIVTMLMAFFNARLGWWLPNPGRAGRRVWNQIGPALSLKPLVDEALGRTSDDRPWVYVSDGGHFENLGLYEMVLRRAKTIVVVDGSADPEFKMDDLGNAFRKIYIDFGIPIQAISRFEIRKGTAPSNRHCAVFEIQYDCVDWNCSNGVLVYLKTSLNDNEPADVVQYATQHSAFPHEPTFNQWFNEAQFESYRRLGAHIIHEIFGGNNPQPRTLREFMEAAKAHAGAP
jgi:hypothetical protein